MEDIGGALGVTRQTAHERFGKHVTAWREPWTNPSATSPMAPPTTSASPTASATPRHPPSGVRTAEQAAKDLEEWLRQRTSRATVGPTSAPVTGLTRNSTSIMLMRLSDIARRLLDEQRCPTLGRRPTWRAVGWRCTTDDP
ncbi:hypothetical protein F3K43_47340 [Streptomyces sp. LBUM 1476]|nr:hypothetical protein [Streptomyces sp. LBUM 1476]